MAKNIARTILDMCSSESMACLIDRSAPFDAKLVTDLIEHWSYDLYSRNPGPALFENGMFKPTDLDLACFMSALADRHAVINLPVYKSRRPKTLSSSQTVVSSLNRHGKILKLGANKETFSFNVTIQDQNVINHSTTEEDSTGAPRSFMLVDLDGTWYDGWKEIVFVPTAKENDFLKDNRLWTNNKVYFKNFIHPNRWISFYGQYYFLTKVMIERLEDEMKFLRSEIKRLKLLYPEIPKDSETVYKKSSTKNEGVSIKVPAFEVEIDVPWKNEFETVRDSPSMLQTISEMVHEVQYNILPVLRFHVRATELAFYQAGLKNKGFPNWISGAAWETGYVQKGKRTEWNRLVYTQQYPWQLGFALRYRMYEKSEIVAE